MATRQEVFSVITDERVFQDRKWGTVEEHPHEVGSWLTIMRQLLNDAERAYMSQRGDIGALDEVRKVVAVGVACLEQHGPVGRKAIDFAAQSKSFTVHKAEAPNARLIAAAPDLLAALLSVTVALEQLVDIDPGSPAALSVSKARAAIAKGRGES